MRVPRTLSLYLVREVLLYTLLGLAAITIVLVTRNLLRFLDDLIGVGLSAGEVFTLVRLLATMLAVYSLPLAFLFGILLAIGRMSADVEITAMRACGLGLREITLPIAVLGTIISGFTWYLVFEVEHAAHRELHNVVKRLAARGAAIEPGRFRSIGPRVVYVRSRGSSNRLEGIMVSDHSDPNRPLMVFAEYGRVSYDEDRGELLLLLENGDIHSDPPHDDERYHRISFLTFEYTFEVSALMGNELARRRPREMSTRELREIVALAESGGSLEHLRKKDRVEYELQIQRRITSPLAALLFAFIGVPLGMRRTRSARASGVLLCVAVAFVYYAILSVSQFMALKRWVSAAVALWIPNLAFAVIAYVLLARARRYEA